MDYKNKNILIVGLARSGIGAANLLDRAGANVTINDIKNIDVLKDEVKKLNKNITLALSSKADEHVKGIDLIVVSPGIPKTLSFFTLANELNIPVLSELELASTFCKAPIVAITGTNGKTTTTSLVGEIFKNAGCNTYIAGNIGFAFSECVEDIQKDDRVIIEVSSFQLEYVKTFRPKISVVLNISPDHIDRHGSYEEYISTKERIFENQNEDDILVLNDMNEFTKDMAKRAKCKCVYFSRNDIDVEGVFVRDGYITIKKDNKLFKVCKSDEISLPSGKYYLENALAATACATFMGIDIESIRFTLKTFTSVEHRLEFVRELDGIRYINDSKGTNVDASICAIDSMENNTILILGGYDKGSKFDELVEKFSEYIKGVVVLGQTKDKICKALDDNGYKNYRIADSFENAINIARNMSNVGYNVLLSPACASFDMFGNFEIRGETFKKIVNGYE